MQVKRVVFGSILEQRVAVHKGGWNVSGNVVTSQRHDFSASFASQSLKSKRGPELGGSKIEERTN